MGYVGQADIKNLKRYCKKKKKKITIITIAAYDIIVFPMKRKTYCVNFFSENEKRFFTKKKKNNV